jgi:predicted PhzF superfamily epimerase YddE/YHI9
MGKPSEIIIELITEDEEVTEVKVGGKAFNLSDMEIEM